MPANDDPKPPAPPNSAFDTIARTADALGVPAKALMDGSGGPLNMKGASELLTIWVEMDEDDDREKPLEFARELATSR